MKALVVLGMLTCWPSVASAVVISNTNITLSPDFGFMGADYALTVYQDAARTDPTTIWFNFTGGSLSFVTTNLDEGSDWYRTYSLDAFSEASIRANQHQVFVRATETGFESNVLSVGSGDFFLGVNSGNEEGEWGDLPPRNLYGWVQLRSQGGVLSMLGNAMSYSGNGIIVGTTQAIPEPSVPGMVLAAVVLMLRRRSAR